MSKHISPASPLFVLTRQYLRLDAFLKAKHHNHYNTVPNLYTCVRSAHFLKQFTEKEGEVNGSREGEMQRQKQAPQSRAR